MSEQLHPREPDSTAKPASATRPTLSRYARRAEPAASPPAAATATTTPAATPTAPGPALAPKEPATAEPSASRAASPAADVPVVADGVEISPRSTELPAPPEASDQSEPDTIEAAADDPAEADSARSSATTAAAPRATAGAAPEAVRRVEPSEVHDSPRDGSWGSSVVPVRGDSGKKLPFWKRIALPLVQGGSAGQKTEGPPARPTSLDPVLTRLSSLEKQLAANQAATEGQLARFEENITRLWELEEQMTITEVRERLALLEANQEEIADGLHNVGRNLILLAVVLSAALAAGLLSLGLLL